MKTKKAKQAQNNSEAPSQAAVTIPSPASLAEQAQKEPRIIAARDYIETINILRHEKSFSFREIASWFNERGVPLDNNEIYRAYMSDLNWQEKQAMEYEGKLPDPED